MVRASSRHQTPPSDIPQEVPMFLRKTYHMIDSCDPVIACWSEDGETFVVKDPSRFETEIIPQFFKHSKFTSFVRQLNFYAFRKIKYVDTIRLDPKLEAETANYWRFRHEKFQRGKPNLLREMKRSNVSRKDTAAANGSKKASSSAASGENPQAMKSEIDTLKKRIEEMNKNMTELTSMVQKVTLTPPKPSTATAAASKHGDVNAGAKRKKIEAAVPDAALSFAAVPVTTSRPTATSAPLPELVGSMDAGGSLIQPDEMLSSAIDFEQVLPMDMGTRSPVQLQSLNVSRVGSPAPSDDAVDRIFQAFNADEAMVDLCHDAGARMEDNTATHLLPDPSTGASTRKGPTSPQRKDRADPELMDRLSEALAILPKEMQEQIVERLISAITTIDLFTATGTDVVPEKAEEEDASADATKTPEVGMPLAAATLAALLSHYSDQVKKHSAGSSHSASGKPNEATRNVKSIPVIPVHA